MAKRVAEKAPKSEVALPEGIVSVKGGFDDLTSAGQFLNRYCGGCARCNMVDGKKESGCKMNDKLRLCMGNDCPYWDDAFMIVRPSSGIDSAIYGRMVICKEYQSRQQTLAFGDHNRDYLQPLEREIEAVRTARRELASQR